MKVKLSPEEAESAAWGERNRETADQALQRRPVGRILAAEAVDDLGPAALGFPVPDVVGQLQVADDRAVFALLSGGA